MYSSTMEVLRDLWRGNVSKQTTGAGVKLGTSFYRGFGITIGRDVPFAMVQFPLYEGLKRFFTARHEDSLLEAAATGQTTEPPTLSPFTSSLCGSLAGGIAAAVSTPLDVARTRLMLGADAQGVMYSGGLATLKRVYNEGVRSAKGVAPQDALALGDAWKYRRGGLSYIFAGVVPRVSWMSLGGSVYFGAFEVAKYLLQSVSSTGDNKKAL
jgi:solute carrier family 25 S-adenosylmethionine transporter 26